MTESKPEIPAEIKESCGDLDQDKKEKIKTEYQLRRLGLALSTLFFIILVFLTIWDIVSEDLLFYIFMLYVISRLTYISATKSKEQEKEELKK